jgi:hypothetical protein
LKHITKPSGWNSDKDFEYFEDIYGEVDNYFSFALERVADECNGLIGVVDEAIGLLEARDKRLGSRSSDPHADQKPDRFTNFIGQDRH